MRSTRPILLALAAALLAAGSAAAEDTAPDGLYQERNEFDQRNRIWSMQGVRDGSYTGEATRNRVQTRTREQERTRSQQQGPDYASRYGQGFESRQGRGSFGGAPGGGSDRSGGGRR